MNLYILRSPQLLGSDSKDTGYFEKSADTEAVTTVLIFLDLLEGYPYSLSQGHLRHAAHDALTANVLANDPVNVGWTPCFHRASTPLRLNEIRASFATAS